MDPQYQPSIAIDCFGIISERRAIGRADFAQFYAGVVENLANPKAAADLHEFATGNDYFAVRNGEMTRDKNQSGRAIVYHGGGLSAAERGEIMFQICNALSAFTRGEVEFKIAVVGGDLRDRSHRHAWERRAAKICV